MGTVHFRPDYAKLLIECHPEHWQSFVDCLERAAASRKYAGEWSKSHRLNRLWFNAQQNLETWSIDIWGEWAGVVELLPSSWFPFLRRLDARAIVWDCDATTILEIGKRLLDVPTGHNIHVFNSRPASKRMGRDRGGQTVAIGSHKSDLRISLYKRTGEPTAQEFQMQGHYLNRLKDEVLKLYGATSEVNSLWSALKRMVVDAGNLRLSRVFEAAGIGTYWPVIGPDLSMEQQSAQHAFIAELADEEDFPDQEDPSRPA